MLAGTAALYCSDIGYNVDTNLDSVAHSKSINKQQTAIMHGDS